MADKYSQWIGWIQEKVDGLEKILRLVAPKYHLAGGDVVAISDEAVKAIEEMRAKNKGAQRSVQREWADLPPIQRTASSMPLVARPGAFVGGLPGTQGLPPVVQQLGHEVSPMAAPGLVVARVRAVEQGSSASIPAPRRSGRTAQRQAAASSADTVETYEPDAIAMPVASAAPAASSSASSSASSASPASSVSVSRSSSARSSSAPVVSRSAAEAASEAFTGAGGDDDELGAASVSAPEMAPVRSLPTVARSAIRVPDRPLTSAAAVVRSAVQRSHAGHSHAAPAAEGTPAAAPLPAPSGGMRRAQTSTVISRSAMPTASRQAGVSAPSTPAGSSSTTTSEPAAGTLPALPALATGPSRRGLGEPTALPSSARPIGDASEPVVSRSTMAGPMPLATSSLRTTIQRIGDGDEGDDDPDAGEGAPVQRSIAAPLVARSPALPSLPVLTASRSAASDVAGSSRSMTGSSSTAAGNAAAGAGAGAAPGASIPTAGSVPLQRAAAAAPAIRPIAAHNPLRPAIAIQRDADDDTGADDEDADGSFPSPWWSPANEPAAGVPARSSGGAGAGMDSGPAVQRSAFSAPASPSTATAMPGAHRSATSGQTWTNPSVQRSSRASASAPRLPLAIPATVAAPQAASAASPGPTWAPGTSVSFPQRSITSDPVVQTSRDGSSGAGPSHASPTIQREGGATTGGTTVTPSSSKEGHSERELDDLARQLFGRIRTRLRADLLQDREAAGFTFDNV